MNFKIKNQQRFRLTDHRISALRQALTVVRNLFDMLKKLTGYLFAILGLLGFIFFRNYNGHIIPLPTLWFLVSIGIGLLGLYLIYSNISSKFSKQEKDDRDRLYKLKKSGEKILLTADNCEIRENSYTQEIVSENNSRVQQLDALYDPNRNYQQTFIEQSALIYNYVNGDNKIRMTSQSFPIDAKTLKCHVQNEKLCLYVNRFDKSYYIFEITD